MGFAIAFFAPAFSLATILGILRSAWSGGRSAALALVAGLVMGRAALLGAITLGGFPPPVLLFFGAPLGLLLLGITPLFPTRLRHPALFFLLGSALGGLNLGTAFADTIALGVLPGLLAGSFLGMVLFFTLYARAFSTVRIVARYHRRKRLWDITLFVVLSCASALTMTSNLLGQSA